MKRKTAGAAIMLAVVLGASVIAPPTASAGGKSVTCATWSCFFEVDGFPGGTLSIDADARQAPSPPPTGDTAYWRIWGANGYTCGTGFPETDPMRSWVCHNVPAGKIRAGIEGTPYLAMGVRW